MARESPFEFRSLRAARAFPHDCGAAATAASFSLHVLHHWLWAFKKGDDASFLAVDVFSFVREDAEVAGLLSRQRDEVVPPVATCKDHFRVARMQNGSNGFGPRGSFARRLFFTDGSFRQVALFFRAHNVEPKRTVRNSRLHSGPSLPLSSHKQLRV